MSQIRQNKDRCKRKPTIQRLRKQLEGTMSVVEEDYTDSRIIVFVPSMSIPEDVLGDITGIEVYEERMLYIEAFLKQPNTHVVFVSSRRIDPSVVAYYAQQFADEHVDASSIEQRFHNVCVGESDEYLARRVLRNKHALEQIKSLVRPFSASVLMCFAVSYAEEQLARELRIPLFGSRASLKCGTKTFARSVFKEAGVYMARGVGGLRTRDEVYLAIATLWIKNPNLKAIVIKADQGVSGVSNARILLENMVPINGARSHVGLCTEHVKCILEDETNWQNVVRDIPHRNLDAFFGVFYACGGGVVEEWIENVIASPSVQIDVLPNGRTKIVSTYEQTLDGTVFKGGVSPASVQYRHQLIEMAHQVGPVLFQYGCLSNVSIDTVVVSENGMCRLYAIEVNVRRGGTTHPIRMAAGATGSLVNEKTGAILTPDGRELFIEAHDNIQEDGFIGIDQKRLIAALKQNRCEFDGERGMVIHLFGLLKQHGKIGGTFMGRSYEEASVQKERFMQLLKLCALPASSDFAH